MRTKRTSKSNDLESATSFYNRTVRKQERHGGLPQDKTHKRGTENNPLLEILSITRHFLVAILLGIACWVILALLFIL